MSDMVETHCVCGTSQDQGVVAEKDGIKAVVCACGVVRTLHRPADYSKTYTDGVDYHAGQCQEKYGYPTFMERFDHDYSIAQGRIALLLRNFRSLDVGCANGGFVRAMAEKGFEAYGLEINGKMAGWAENRTSRPIFSSYEAVRSSVGYQSMDIITYHDVFEHVVDPHAEMREINETLKPGGMLVLDVPEACEVVGPHPRAPHHLKPEQHLWYWDEMPLRIFFGSYGYGVLRVDRPIVGKLVLYTRRWLPPA